MHLKNCSQADSACSRKSMRGLGTDLTWIVILATAALIGSILFACLTPFAALAVVFAGTLRLSFALSAILCVWLINQIMGFGFFGYPHTASTILQGAAIGVASLLATYVSAIVIERSPFRAKTLNVAAAFVAAFVLYEITLFANALVAGGLATFAPEIIGRIALTNSLWLGGMIVLNEIVSALSPLWRGKTVRLVRA